MKRTRFYNCHIKNNAKMVDFAGFEMPVHYSSIIAEHKAVRSNAGVFDVSHMGEIIIKGKEALNLVQHLTVNNAARLEIGKVQYSAMCNDKGGIIDDLLIYRMGENEYMLVVNGANIEKDFNWMVQNNQFDAEVVDQSDDYSLLAIQGPKSQSVVEKLFDKKIDIDYYSFTISEVFGIEIIVSRTGYTGETGYELYFKGTAEQAENIWDRIFKMDENSGIVPAGLGCRDSLRLEMGYCLYGNDIDESTNPLEAGLGWITKLKKGEFLGRDVLVEQKENGISKKLVPIIFESKVFPRKDYEIQKNNKVVGRITSGTVSPILEKPIALGYVNAEIADEENSIDVVVRGKLFPAKITKLPFVKK